MIKINLAKSHDYAPVGTQAAIEMDRVSSSDYGKEVTKKVLLILICPILFYVYESHNLDQLRQELGQAQAQVRKVQEESKQYGSVSAVVDSLVQERKKLNAQLAVIQEISRKRSFKLAAIHQVQESVIEDLWLTEMAIKEDIIHFKGVSRKPTSAQTIVKNLLQADFVQSAVNRELKRVEFQGEPLNSFDIEVVVKK